MRSDSLASVPYEDRFLELHIERKQNGAMSSWIFDRLAANNGVEF